MDLHKILNIDAMDVDGLTDLSDLQAFQQTAVCQWDKLQSPGSQQANQGSRINLPPTQDLGLGHFTTLNGAAALMSMSQSHQVAPERDPTPALIEQAVHRPHNNHSEKKYNVTPPEYKRPALLLTPPFSGPSFSSPHMLIEESGSLSVGFDREVAGYLGERESVAAAPSHAQEHVEGTNVERPVNRKRTATNYRVDAYVIGGRAAESGNSHHQRFTKNIGVWLGIECRIGAGRWDYRSLERLTGGIGRNLAIPAEFQPLPGARIKMRKVEQGDDDLEAAQALAQTEVDACNYYGWKYSKYRVTKLALLIGFACIYEQNERGFNGQACVCHASTREKGAYDTIRAGTSQAQMVTPKMDVTEVSGVYKLLSSFGWFVPEFAEEYSPGQYRLRAGVQEKFPKHQRERIMEEFEKFEDKMSLSAELQMAIRNTPCVCGRAKVTEAKSLPKSSCTRRTRSRR